MKKFSSCKTMDISLIPMNLHLSLAEMAVWPSVTGLIESRYWLPLINHLVYEEETEE